VVREQLRDRVAACRQQIVSKAGTGYPREFSRRFALSSIGLLAMLSLGREIVAAGSVGMARDFSFVSLCDLLQIDLPTSAKAAGL
jgi:hypothetical protein